MANKRAGQLMLHSEKNPSAFEGVRVTLRWYLYPDKPNTFLGLQIVNETYNQHPDEDDEQAIAYPYLYAMAFPDWLMGDALALVALMGGIVDENEQAWNLCDLEDGWDFTIFRTKRKIKGV